MNIKSNPHYPVEALLENINETLKKLGTQYEFNDAFTKGFKNKIKFLLSDNPIEDVAELDLQNQIKLYDNFCQFFWCLCFSSILFYDKGIIEKQMTSEFACKIDMSEQETKLAFSVFEAGVGLLNNSKEITPRYVFFELPNPYNNVSHEYVGKANNVFCFGMAFIIYHEFSHFQFNHIASTINNEEVADSNSFWTLYSNVTEEEKVTATIGMILALCALIFIDNTMKGDENHPDGDIRVASLLKNIESEFDHYWGIACISIKMWAFNYGYDDKLPDVKEIDSWKLYFQVILNYFEKFKSNLVQNNYGI